MEKIPTTMHEKMLQNAAIFAIGRISFNSI